MSDKDKTKTAPANTETPEATAPEKPAAKAKDEAKPVEAKPAKIEATPEPVPVPQPVEPNAPRPARPGLFGRRSGETGEAKADLFSLADATGTNTIILAALKSAYGWTERTRLTRAEFLEKRDAWLKRPAKEG